jgi:hypothetical protein
MTYCMDWLALTVKFPIKCVLYVDVVKLENQLEKFDTCVKTDMLLGWYIFKYSYNNNFDTHTNYLAQIKYL